MEKAIALSQASLEESAARAAADTARARAAEAEEKIKTARETEEANRRRTVDVVMAEIAAEREKIAADAERVRRAVEAEAQRLVNEAENVLTEPARASLFKRRLLERVEGIVAASVKPLEKINDIRIMTLDGGMGGNGNGGAHRTATDEVIDFGLALPGAGAAGRQPAGRSRHRRRQHLQDGRPHPRGERHAAHRQGRRTKPADGGGGSGGGKPPVPKE